MMQKPSVWMAFLVFGGWGQYMSEKSMHSLQRAGKNGNFASENN